MSCVVKLVQVPSDFKPTWEGRGWIVNPFHPDNPWWIIPGTMLPAALATILLFLDQQITAVIVNRRENKLRVLLLLNGYTVLVFFFYQRMT